MELRLQLRNENSGVKLNDSVEVFFSKDTITEWRKGTTPSLTIYSRYYYALKKSLANTLRFQSTLELK